MSVANQIHDYQANCLVPLISLRMLAQGDAGTPLPRWVVVEVAQATSTVLAEAEAAGYAMLTAVGLQSDHPEGWTFLRVRLDRLATAADDAITAAREGDTGAMGRHLRRFDALTSAIWTVQDAVYGSHQVESAPCAADHSR